MYQELRELILEAKEHGLPTVMWAYPRGAGLPKEGEQAVDIMRLRGADRRPARRAHHQGQAAEGRHHQDEAKKVFEKSGIPTKTLADRVRHVVQIVFTGKRIVIFSGGETKDTRR